MGRKCAADVKQTYPKRLARPDGMRHASLPTAVQGSARLNAGIGVPVVEFGLTKTAFGRTSSEGRSAVRDAHLDMRKPVSMIEAVLYDDDESLARLIAEFCAAHDIRVRAASSAAQLEQWLDADPVDVLLLDVGLPGEDGFSICRRLRVRTPSLPIIVVSGRGDDLDRILGLELGADDYVTKPFVPRELVARIKALHRRIGRPVADRPDADTVRFGPYTVDLRRRELTRNGQTLGLTNAEFDLLAVFCRHPGRALKRGEILEQLGPGSDPGVSERGVDVTVVRLRKLLEDDPKTPSYIKTVWRVGYVFTP